jgi:hypothetical protein
MDIVPPLIINLVEEFIILAPSTLIPGNLPIITSANEVAPGDIPYPELFILSVVLDVEDLQLKDKTRIDAINNFFIINFL